MKLLENIENSWLLQVLINAYNYSICNILSEAKNDLLCVEWAVKPTRSLSHSTFIKKIDNLL